MHSDAKMVTKGTELNIFHRIAGAYALENPLAPLEGGGSISADFIWGQDMKRGREKGRKYK
jgi:hypothetical protein